MQLRKAVFCLHVHCKVSEEVEVPAFNTIYVLGDCVFNNKGMQIFCNFYSGNSTSNIIQSTINKSFLLVSYGNRSYKVTELSPASLFVVTQRTRDHFCLSPALSRKRDSDSIISE